MRVCHVTSVHKNNDIRIFYKECKSLSRNGYDVFLVAPGESYTEDGVKVIGLGEKPKNKLIRMISYTNKAYKTALKINADIYHLHDPELLPIAIRLKKNNKIVIFDSNEFYGIQIKFKFEKYLGKEIAKIISNLYTTFEDFVLKRIDGLITPCLRKGINVFEGKCKNIEIIGNTPILQSNNEVEHTDISFKNNKNICYVGCLAKARGIENIVRAAYETGATLHLAGEFSPSVYQQEIFKMKESECIKYYGFIDHKKITKLINNCQIGLATLLNEGQYYSCDNLSTKVYEYMESGKPVILFDSAYNKSMVEKYHFGICINPNDVNDIASNIKRLLDNPDLMKEMGYNGKQTVIHEFNWSVEEKKLLSFYSKLINSKN